MAVVFHDNAYATKDPTWRRVLDKLSDVWDGKQTGLITAAHMAWEKCAMYFKDQVLRRRFSHMLLSDEYTKIFPDNPMPIQLWFVDTMPDTIDEGVIVCPLISGTTYRIPENIRSISILTDAMTDPEVTLTAWDGNFTVTSHLSRGYTGTIEFHSPVGDDLHVARMMWATRYSEKKNEEMVERFGPEVGYLEAMYTEYRTFYDLFILRGILLTGPTRPALEAAFNIVLGWPYAMINLKVKALATDLFTVEPYPTPDGVIMEIPNPTELPCKYIVGDVVGAGAPLTDAIRVLDRMNYPTLLSDFILNPAEIYHKGLLVFNGDLPILEDILGFQTVPPPVAFIANERVVGQISGAFGYVWEVLPDGLKMYGVVGPAGALGTFIDGEQILGDVAGNAIVDFANGELAPHYDIDYAKVAAFMEKTERYGADLEIKNLLDFRMSAATYATSHARRIPMLEYDIETTGPSSLFIPEAESVTTHALLPSEPIAWAISSLGVGLPLLTAEAISSLGLSIPAPVIIGVPANLCGWLSYKFVLIAPFKVGSIISGVTSGATGIIAFDENDGSVGRLLLISVHGQFEIGETIVDELVGTATVTSGLQ